MDSVALIAPDFSIILLGLLLRLKFEYSEDFWKQALETGRTACFLRAFSAASFHLHLWVQPLARRICRVPRRRHRGDADRRLRVLVYSLFGEG